MSQTYRHCSVAFVVILAVALSSCSALNWNAQGPVKVEDVYSTENITGALIIGAVTNVVLNGDLAFIGTVNGGVWKTTNIHAAGNSPQWVPLTDHASVTCSSIGALAYDAATTRILAGCSNPSNYQTISSEMGGVMLSTNGGSSWSMVGLAGYSISDVLFTSSTTLLASVRAEYVGYSTISNSGNRGIWRSSNNGGTWSKIAMPDIGPDSTTSKSAIYRMVADKNDANFIVAVSPLGVYLTTTGGASWSLQKSGLDLSSTEISSCTNAVASVVSINSGAARTIWVGYTNGSSYAIYWSTDNGATFTAFTNQPGTMEGGVFQGLGNQGNPNFALAGDPTDLTVVYVGGTTVLNISKGNSLGATAYSGRLFRGSRTTSVWTPLTHATYTTSASSPHADCRFLVWDFSTGNLVESSDGGLYYRTLPKTTTGDWFPLSGDLSISEYLSANYEPVTRIFIGGAQDNGAFMSNPALSSTGLLTGRGVVSGDGGYTGIDPNGGKPRFYVTSQNLGMRYMYKENYENRNDYFDATTTYNPSFGFYYSFAGTALAGSSTTPMQPLLVVNAADATRQIACVSRPTPGCYDLKAQTASSAQSVTTITTSFYSAYIYGGRSASGVYDAEVFLGVSSTHVIARSSSNLNPTPSTSAPTTYGWGECVYLTANEYNYREALMTCRRRPITSLGDSQQSTIFLTSDFGTTWTDITGDLFSVVGARHDFRPQSTLIVNLGGDSSAPHAYLVGTYKGVYVSFSHRDPKVWMRVGSRSEFPMVISTRMVREPVTDLLVVATMGRGIFTLAGVSTALSAISNISIDCQVSNWTAYGACSKTCGGGTSTRTRSILVRAYNGVVCPTDLSQSIACNPQNCGDVSTTGLVLRANIDISSTFASDFKPRFVSACASALQLPSSRFEVVTTAAGSTMITVAIIGDPKSTALPITIAQTMQQQAADPNSALSTAMATASIPLDPTYSPTILSVSACYDGTYAQPCPEKPIVMDWTLVNYGLYALGGLLLIVLFLSWRHHAWLRETGLEGEPEERGMAKHPEEDSEIEVSQL